MPPYLYKSADNPEGGFDEATLRGTDLVSEPLRRYNAAIAAAASPKGTLDCTTAFTKTDSAATSVPRRSPRIERHPTPKLSTPKFWHFCGVNR